MKKNKKSSDHPKQPIIGINLKSLYEKTKKEGSERLLSFAPSFLIRSLNKGSKVNVE